MEQVVLRNQENASELLEVVGHHDVLGRTLGQAEKSVNVLDTLEGLLPELELDSNVELQETGVKVALESLRLAKVNGVDLLGVLGSVLQVVAEQLTETSELSLTGVLLAEVEGLVSGGLVHDLKTGVVLEDVENGAVGLPQELQPGSDNRAVCPVAGLLTRDSGEEDRLRGLHGLKIADIVELNIGVGRAARDLVSLGLCLLDLAFGEVDELAEDELDGGDVGVLAGVLVVVKTILGGLALLEIHAELDEKQHHRLKRDDGAVARPLGGDMLVKDGESSLLLANANQLLGPLENILGAGVRWRRHIE